MLFFFFTKNNDNKFDTALEPFTNERLLFLHKKFEKKSGKLFLYAHDIL